MASLRLTGALAVALLLSGCVAAVPPPKSGLSEPEQALIRQMMNDSYWSQTGLPDDQRPADPPIEFVSHEEWSASFVGCMNAEGFDNYTAEQDGYSVESAVDETPEELLAFYECGVRYPVDYEYYGYYNEAQKDYLYDYYEQMLIPCLVNHGVHIFNAPSREKFKEDSGSWIPYFSVRKVDVDWVLDDDKLHRDCPMFPPGMPDPGYFE